MFGGFEIPNQIIGDLFPDGNIILSIRVARKVMIICTGTLDGLKAFAFKTRTVKVNLEVLLKRLK